MTKAIFFDVANTLLHKPALMESILVAFKKFGHEIPLSQIKTNHQKLTEEIVFPDETTKEFYLGFNAKLCESLNMEATDSLVNEIFEASKGLEWAAFDDLLVLKELSIPIGIASNWDKSLRTKLKHYFSYDFRWILVSEELGVKKPHSEFFDKMLEASGFEANEIMFVGDSMRLDINPSKNAGMQAVLIDRNNFYSAYNGVKINSMNQLSSLL